jgi:hypothetical protein
MLEASPAIEPRIGWQETVLRARADIDEFLPSSPSLRPSLDAVVARQHGRALHLVANVLRSMARRRACRWTGSNIEPTRCSGRGSDGVTPMLAR